MVLAKRQGDEAGRVAERKKKKMPTTRHSANGSISISFIWVALVFSK